MDLSRGKLYQSAAATGFKNVFQIRLGVGCDLTTVFPSESDVSWLAKMIIAVVCE